MPHFYRADAFPLVYEKVHFKYPTLPRFEPFYFVAGLLPLLYATDP